MSIFAPESVSHTPFWVCGLKGNRVRIPDSPAAVKLYKHLDISLTATGD